MSTPRCQLCAQPSVYYCTCTNPPIPTCHDCSYTHHGTPGAHNWSVFQQPAHREMSCALCSTRPAEFVCCCKFPVTPLCSQCRVEHILKTRLAMHIEQPTEKAALIKSFEDIERARRVLENKDRIEEYLNRNKAAAEKLRDEVTALAEKLVAQITSAKEATLKEISNTERDIEGKRKTLKQTVESYLFQVEVRCADPLLSEAFDTLKAFTCTEVLQGELQVIDQIGPLLAQLHIPPYLEVHEVQTPSNQPSREVGAEASVPSGAMEEMDTKMMSPLVPAVAASQSHAPEAGDNLQVPEQQKRPLSSADFGNQQDSSQTIFHRPSPEEAVRTPVIPPNRLPQHDQCEVTQEMQDFVHAPCREDFHSRTPEIPIAIGRHRLAIESLWNELMIAEVQSIAGRFSTWRRSRGDGNSFYRCVGVLLSEHYCRPDTPVQEVVTMYKAMLEQRQPFVLMSDSTEVLSHLKLWQRMLKEIYLIRTRGENALQRLQYFLQRPKFDKAIVIAMRNYTAAYCKLHAKDPDVSAALLAGSEPAIQEIMEYEKEAEGIALKFTAQTFNVILHILTLDVKTGQIVDTAYGPTAKGWYPSMHLLRLPAHYNYLVPRNWDATDHYDFTANTYNPVPVQTAVDYEEYVPT